MLGSSRRGSLRQVAPRRYAVGVVAALVVATMSFVPSTSAAGLRSMAPDDVNPAVLGRSANGPVLATGAVKLDGRGAAHTMIAAQAWPARAKLASMKVGDGFYAPTVGWATTNDDGSFSLSVDVSRLTPDFVGENGKINLNLVAWNDRMEGRWGETAWLGSTDEAKVTAIAASGSRAPRSIHATVELNRPRTARTAKTADLKASAAGVAACTPTSTSQTWPATTAYTDYAVREQYGKYGLAICGTNNYTQYQETEIQPTGTYTTIASSGPYLYPQANCDTQGVGEWNRSDTTGKSFSLATGIKLKAVIGMDLKSTSSWTSQKDLFYKLTRPGQLCGKDALPGTASSVEAKS
jgi:hypothetical protein